MGRLIFLFPGVFLCMVLFSCKSSSPYYAEVKGNRIYLEIAADSPSRQKGLQFRDSLGKNSGMLFIFPEEDSVSFWMENTFIPLDIAFIDSSGKIVGTDSMEPHSRFPVTSRVPAKYVLEVNRGFLSGRSIEEGDTVLFSEAVKDIVPE